MAALHLPDPDTKAEVEVHERLETLDAVDSEEIAAHLSAQEEQSQTVSEALRSSPWAIVWLCYGVWIILCCSFDSNAGSLVLGIPRFRQDFGYAFQGDYVLPADWQSAFSGGPAATQVLGTFVSGSEYLRTHLGSTDYQPWETRSAGNGCARYPMPCSCLESRSRSWPTPRRTPMGFSSLEKRSTD
jgi:hypothetical protein